MLRDNVVAQGVQRLLAAVGHGDFGARRAPLALLEFATHCSYVVVRIGGCWRLVLVGDLAVGWMFSCRRHPELAARLRIPKISPALNDKLEF